MKNFNASLAVLLIFFLAGCGEQGPPGLRGFDGPQGAVGEAGESGFVFEYEAIDFTASNEYLVLLNFSEDFNFEGRESDVVLVYFLWDVTDGLDVWRPLPQTLITENGLLQYNYDFTKSDVSVFLDADFPLDQLTALDTDDWVVRIVVVPGEFFNPSGKRDMSYDAIKGALGLPELPAHETVVQRRE